MTTYTQDHLYLSVNTPLGKDKLLLQAFYGEERLSGLFQYSLELISTDRDISFDAITGKGATIAMRTAEVGTCYIDGIIGRFYQGGTDAGFTAYYAELHPWLW